MCLITGILSVSQYVKWDEFRPKQAILSSSNIFHKMQYSVNQMVVIQLKCKVVIVKW